jgi:hypothetical protein
MTFRAINSLFSRYAIIYSSHFYFLLPEQLLSTDETWMYAPLAYNGVSIDLDATANES